MFEVCYILCVFWLSHSKQLLLKAPTQEVICSDRDLQATTIKMAAGDVKFGVNPREPECLQATGSQQHSDHILRGRLFTL